MTSMESIRGMPEFTDARAQLFALGTVLIPILRTGGKLPVELDHAWTALNEVRTQEHDARDILRGMMNAELGDRDGHPGGADNSHDNSADRSPSDLNGDGAGQSNCADDVGRAGVASPSPLNGDGEGQRSSAGDGQCITAHPSPTNGEDAGYCLGADEIGHPSIAPSSPTERDDVGQNPIADTATRAMPMSSPPDRGGEGHISDADDGQALSAHPVREPSAEDLAAAAEVMQSIANTVLDTFKIDGIGIGNWNVYEALKAGTKMVFNGRVLLRAARHVRYPKPSDTIRDVCKPADIERFIAEEQEQADAA